MNSYKHLVEEIILKELIPIQDEKLEREISLVQDFMKDTRTDIINIKEKIKVIKK